MKSKSLKLLIAAATPIALVTTFGLQTLSSCSSKQEEKICTIKGIVKDIDGTTLKNVTVQCNDKTTKTNASGKFVIECEKPSSIIYFEKEGFLPTAVNEYSYDKTLNISLTPLSETTSKEITFNLVDMQGSYIPNCSLSIYSESSEEYFQHLVTDNVGTCKAEIQVATTGKTFIPFTINNSLYDGQQQILSVDSSTTSVTLTAKPYQYDIKAYVDNKNTDNHIIMHAYHVKNNGDSSLKVSFEANFTGAFTSKRKYTLTFHVGNVPSSPKQTEIIGNDFAIQFNSSKVTQTYGDIVKTKDKNLVKVQLSKSKAYLDVIIPSSFYDLESVGTIGIHLSSSSGSFQPFDHKDASTQVSNQLCYIRLDQDNKYYQASDNNNPFGTLDWSTETGNDWTVTTLAEKDYLGEIGPKFNFGYKLKIAKSKTNDTGIYLLTKYQQDQMSHFLPDTYQPHFFFDVHEYSTPYPQISDQPADDGKVIHYSPFSGYWMKKYTVTSPESACDDPQEYDQFFEKDGVRIYSKEDLMITYIPYEALGIEQGEKFGFACNLYYHYTGGEWFAWNGQNPTGFPGTSGIQAIPHFEHLVSYIRFANDLSVIPYSA